MTWEDKGRIGAVRLGSFLISAVVWSIVATFTYGDRRLDTMVFTALLFGAVASTTVIFTYFLEEVVLANWIRNRKDKQIRKLIEDVAAAEKGKEVEKERADTAEAEALRAQLQSLGIAD